MSTTTAVGFKLDINCTDTKQLHAKKRAFLPKVKTGCSTCKYVCTPACGGAVLTTQQCLVQKQEDQVR